jgi:Gpi18-like mannosyltransferase
MLHISLSTAGIIVSNLSFFLSLIVLNNMLKKSKNRNIILALYAFSPILAFTTMCYTESLYLLLTILTFYYYKKKEYLISAFFLGLSMLTRNTGYILMFAICIDMISKYIKKDNVKIKNILLYIFISSSIGMIYPIYLFIKTGDFLYFSSIQFDFWHRANGYVIFTIINDLKYLIHYCSGADIYIFTLNWLFFLISIILGIKIYKKDKISSIYLITSTIFCALTYRVYKDSNSVLPSISLFRYIFTLFPIYLYIPSIKIKNINVRVLLYVLYFTLSFINIIGIYCGGFIA